MAFIQEAQQFLAYRTVPSLQGLLARDEYVHRLLFHAKADVQEGLLQYRLRKTYAPSDEDRLILEDRKLEKQPYLFLIGNAGSGKSYVFAFGCLEAVQHFFQHPLSPVPFFIDLGKDLSTDFNVERTLNAKYAGLFQRALTESPGGCALFFDGLDEVLRKAPRFINDLTIFLNEHRAHLARVVIACRRAMWNAAWLAEAPLPLVAYHIDHLDEEDYIQILREQPACRAFFERCQALRIAPLLDSPFDGFYLARKFRDGQPLPPGRHACLSERIDEALKGREVDRQEGTAPPVEGLRFLAGQLACLATFTHADAWTPQDAIDVLGASPVLREGRPVRPEEVCVLLRRPLFRRLDDRFSFTHQLYQEFLTAEVLAHLPLRKQRQLLKTARPGCHRIQTPHRGIAALLAETSAAFRDDLMASDPLVAFLAEMPALPPEKGEQLLRAVLDDAIANNRAPWWEIPPRSERLSEALVKHGPRDMASFLRPYLESPHQFARLWGALCAKAWGGSKALKPPAGRTCP
jgi:hypothetical protein